MNAIKSIEIQNFQSHQNTKIALAPAGQLTIITGQTDSGKTAIFRALRWLLYNTPQGSDFIRAGCTFCRVTAEMESGHTVIREMTKSASKNQYRIVAPGAEKPVVLEGFGRSVPVEVQEITGVKTVTIGDMDFDLNMAEQLDGPFLGKSVSAGVRAKVLGKLAGTEVLDFAGKTVGTDLHRKSQDEKRLTAEVNQLVEIIATYDYLPKMAEKIAAIDLITKKVKTGTSRREQLFAIQNQLKSVNTLIFGCNQIINRWRFIDNARNIETDITLKAAKKDNIIVTERHLRVAQINVDRTQQTIIRLKNVDMAGMVTAGVAELTKRAKTILNTKNQITVLAEEIFKCQGVINQFKNVGAAEQATNQIADQGNRAKALLSLKTKIDTLNLLIGQGNATLDKYSGLDKAEMCRRNAASIFNERRAKLANIAPETKRLEIVINATKTSIAEKKQQIVKLESTYKDELVAAGVCPTCGAVTSNLN